MPTRQLQPLRQIPLSRLQELPLPALKIRSDTDVQAWKETRGYSDYGLFLGRLNEAVVAHFLPSPPFTPESEVSSLSFPWIFDP